MGMFDNAKKYQTCNKTGSEFERALIKDELEYNFKSFPNYTIAYKNLNYNEEYDILVVDEVSNRTSIQGKTFISYPYESPKFELGNYLSFKDSTGNIIDWLVETLDTQYNFRISGRIRKINNKIKFYDEFDVLREILCVIDYNYTGTSVDFDQSINIPMGDAKVVMQYNEHSSKLKINDRIIFNGQAYKIESINNFLENQTLPQDSTPLLYLDIYKDSEAEGDDLINNIPVSNIDYTISLDTMSIDQSIGYTTQLVATVKRNGEVYSTPITWTSSDELIATVDTNGNVELLADGNVIITASMTENNDVSVDCNVTVQAVPVSNIEVRITPNVTEILQTQTQSYECQLYTNGILTPASFTFSGSVVPVANYVLTTVDGNHFTVKNLKLYTGGLLKVTASDGINVGEIDIKLKGMW